MARADRPYCGPRRLPGTLVAMAYDALAEIAALSSDELTRRYEELDVFLPMLGAQGGDIPDGLLEEYRQLKSEIQRRRQAGS